jgi:hypothetical protein
VYHHVAYEGGFWRGILRERDRREDISVDGRTILRLILKEISWETMDWIDLAQDREG